MIDRRTHDLMALTTVQTYTHMAMDGMTWALPYAQTIEGDEDRVKQIKSIYEQLDALYRMGLRELMDAEGKE
jgi:hypothetical protein